MIEKANRPFADLFLLILAALYLLASSLLIASTRQRKPGVAGVRSASQATALSPEKEAQR